MHGTEKVKVIRICFKDSGGFKDRTYSTFSTTLMLIF